MGAGVVEGEEAPAGANYCHRGSFDVDHAHGVGLKVVKPTDLSIKRSHSFHNYGAGFICQVITLCIR